MTSDWRRGDLDVLIGYVQDNVDQLSGDALLRLAVKLFALTADDDVIHIDGLPAADVEELFGLIGEVAADNGQVWKVVITNPAKPEDGVAH